MARRGAVLFVQHSPLEGPGRLGRLCEKRGIPWAVAGAGGDVPLPPSARSLRGLVLLGGAHSAGDGESLSRSYALLRSALAEKIPVLGICLGAQMLARAAGGRVVRGPYPEIGFYRVRWLPAAGSDPVCAPLRKIPALFEWHHDAISPPPGSVRLASSALFPAQAFRFGARAWGLLFHPEVGPREIRAWAPAFRRDLRDCDPKSVVRGILSTARDLEARIAPAADASLAGFLDLL